MTVTLSGGGHAATDHQPPIAAARTEVHDSPWVRLDLSPADRREVVRAFVCALQGFAATGHLVAIRQRTDLLTSAQALTEVADSPAVVEALTFLLSPADADTLSVALDEASTTGLEPGPICGICYGVNGNHRMLHVRHGNGGGHNKPCPAADPESGVA